MHTVKLFDVVSVYCFSISTVTLAIELLLTIRSEMEVRPGDWTGWKVMVSAARTESFFREASVCLSICTRYYQHQDGCP